MLFGKKKRIEEQEKTIAELTEKLTAQQQLLESLQAQVEEYKGREHAISRAMTDAVETATRIVSDAQKESDDIHDAAQKEYLSSQKQGEELVQAAYENARDIVKNAEETSEKKIQKTDAAVSAYVELLNQFNDSMKEQARQAEENVRRLSEYYARLNSALPDLFAEVPQLCDTLNASRAEEPLPDPEGDPAQLMRNIYAIEHRLVPDGDLPDRTSIPEEPAPEPKPQSAEQGEERDAENKPPIPTFAAEEGQVIRVSDIVSEDLGTIDTDEFIEKTAALQDHLFPEDT